MWNDQILGLFDYKSPRQQFFCLSASIFQIEIIAEVLQKQEIVFWNDVFVVVAIVVTISATVVVARAPS